MEKLGSVAHINIYVVFIWVVWLASTAHCTSGSGAYEGLPRNPLQGSRQRLPGDRDAMWNSSKAWPGEGGRYVYHGNKELTRLLDVGACMSSLDENAISFVPPLDGATPVDTLCQDEYAMKFVLFDLQLVELKSIDPIGGSFEAEFQMILHWVDSIKDKADKGTKLTDDCTFPCDTELPSTLCCDSVWVPPLHLPTCDIQKTRSSTPDPQPYIDVASVGASDLSYDDCFKQENVGTCFWRRLWYVNIDVSCASDMDFHDFPFDAQRLTFDILNPYASRTWFQLTRGFLQDHMNDDINSVNLSPDATIPGWSMKELKVSSTCGISKNWKQTFLTQVTLLKELIANSSATFGDDKSQYKDIIEQLSKKTLTCSSIEDFGSTNTEEEFTSLTKFDIYKSVRDKYEKRVQSTLKEFKQCIKEKGTNVPGDMSMYENDLINLQPFQGFNKSKENMARSFNILDLERGPSETKVSSLCAILAVANLTTPGIQVSILVQRDRTFYVLKLVLPIVACVAFSFAAVGLHPQELLGRLTVVVPSAIALTALQGLVVSTDNPPVKTTLRSTIIFLISYLVQLLISFESILVSCLITQRRQDCLPRGKRRHEEPLQNVIIMNQETNSYGNIKGGNDPANCTRKFDVFLMLSLLLVYIMAIVLLCTISWHNSKQFEKGTSTGNFVILWPQSTN